MIYLFQWKEADPSELMDSKLKCVFEVPDSGSPAVRYYKATFTHTSNILLVQFVWAFMIRAVSEQLRSSPRKQQVTGLSSM